MKENTRKWNKMQLFSVLTDNAQNRNFSQWVWMYFLHEHITFRRLPRGIFSFLIMYYSQSLMGMQPTSCSKPCLQLHLYIYKWFCQIGFVETFGFWIWFCSLGLCFPAIIKQIFLFQAPSPNKCMHSLKKNFIAFRKTAIFRHRSHLSTSHQRCISKPDS